MTLKVAYDPETGQPQYKSNGHVVIVGPYVSGHVTTSDGTRVNVNPVVVEAASPEHAAEIAHLVSQRLADEGHPLHDAENPFIYDGSQEG